MTRREATMNTLLDSPQPHHPAARSAGRGFTLVELIVSSIIVALMAGATTVAISRSIRSRDASQARFDAFSHAASAADLIAIDVQNAARDENDKFVKLSITAGGDKEMPSSGIMLLAAANRPARGDPDKPEGPVHEVQYRLEKAAGSPLQGGSEIASSRVLWRRDDPLPDEYLDAGGVATPAVARIKSVSIEAYDGNQWQTTWDSDYDGLPHAVRVTVVASAGDPERTAVARRTIAIDRTPLPETNGSATPATPADNNANQNNQNNQNRNRTNTAENNGQQSPAGNGRGRGRGNGNGGGRGGRGNGGENTGPAAPGGRNPGTPAQTPGNGFNPPPGGGGPRGPGGGPPGGGRGGGGTP